MEWNGRKDAEHGGSNDAVSRHPGDDIHKEPEGWVDGTDNECLVGGDTEMECWVGERTPSSRWKMWPLRESATKGKVPNQEK